MIDGVVHFSFLLSFFPTFLSIGYHGLIPGVDQVVLCLLLLVRLLVEKHGSHNAGLSPPKTPGIFHEAAALVLVHVVVIAVVVVVVLAAPSSPSIEDAEAELPGPESELFLRPEVQGREGHEISA